MKKSEAAEKIKQDLQFLPPELESFSCESFAETRMIGGAGGYLFREPTGLSVMVIKIRWKS